VSTIFDYFFSSAVSVGRVYWVMSRVGYVKKSPSLVVVITMFMVSNNMILPPTSNALEKDYPKQLIRKK